MARLVFAESYFDSITEIVSARLQSRLEHLLELMEEVPTFGSRKVRDSLKDEFGPNCMTADLSPFELVFEYDTETDTVYVYGIRHQRRIR